MTNDNRIMGIDETKRELDSLREKASPDVEKLAHAEVARCIFTEKPTIRFKDVAGMDEVKQAIQKYIPFDLQGAKDDRQLNVPPGGGILLYGPPGNGKTFIVEAIAGEMNAPIFFPGAFFKSRYVGETGKNMRALFEEAAKHDRAVIFFDNVEMFLGRRSNKTVNMIGEFLVCADGISEHKNDILIMGTTSIPWLLDDTVLRKLFVNQIYVGMPNSETARKIFEQQFDGVPHEDDFSFDEFVKRLVGKKKIFSSRDIKQICRAVKKRAIAHMIDNNVDSPVILKEYVLSAIDAMMPTISQDSIEKCRLWRNLQTEYEEQNND